jgi:hypothetical protein
MTGQGDNRPNEVIEHAPVTLRRWRQDDVDALFDAVTESLDHLRPWMPWAADYSRASAEEYLAGSIKHWDEGTEYNYAITTAGALVGSISLMARIGPGGLEIGYWLHRAYTRRGLGAGGRGIPAAWRGPRRDRARRAERGQRRDTAQARLHRGRAPPARRALAGRQRRRRGLAPDQGHTDQATG